MPRGTSKDKVLTSRFIVDIDGFTEAGFRECTGLQEESETVEDREGTDPDFARKQPGLTTYSSVVLRKGVLATPGENLVLFKWRQAIRNGLDPMQATIRKTVTIQVLGGKGPDDVVRTYVLYEAWPKTLKSPDYNADQKGEIAVDELTLEYDYYDVK